MHRMPVVLTTRWPWIVTAGRAALPQRVDHRLDVLLVHEQQVGVVDGVGVS